MRLFLKLAILAANSSQRRVAAKCKIAESRFSEIVRGWAEPREHERQAIADELGMSVDELFGE